MASSDYYKNISNLKLITVYCLGPPRFSTASRTTHLQIVGRTALHRKAIYNSIKCLKSRNHIFLIYYKGRYQEKLFFYFDTFPK